MIPSFVGEYVRGCGSLCAAEAGPATYRRIPFTVHPQGKILPPSRGVEDAALYIPCRNPSAYLQGPHTGGPPTLTPYPAYASPPCRGRACPARSFAISTRLSLQTGICNYIPYILAFFTITLSPFSNCSLETPLNPSPTCSVLYPQPFDFRSFVCISMVVIIVSNTPPFVL